jgi:uncharacterized protein DUF5996
MTTNWPAVPYEEWRATCDTLHAHTQVLGKIATKLAPPEPQLLHTALRLTPRGWETLPLPAPDGSGAFALTLDMHRHEVVVEHADGRLQTVPLTPNRAVRDCTRDVLAAVRAIAGPVEIAMSPQETEWETPLDEDTEHATYDTGQVEDYHAAASRVALVLAALRAPYRGRATPVNAWWGSFDIAVTFFSGNPAEPPSKDYIFRNSMDAQEITVGWWPGDFRYPKAALYAYAHPAAPGLADRERWNADLGEFILDWNDVVASADPFATALEFGRSFALHACAVCAWDPALAASLEGRPPPIR